MAIPFTARWSSYGANRTYTGWLNRNAFVAPANGSCGSLGVNNLVGPNYFNLDIALSRNFPIKEKQSLEIRAEAFNIENRVNFLNPSNPGLMGNASGSALKHPFRQDSVRRESANHAIGPQVGFLGAPERSEGNVRRLGEHHLAVNGERPALLHQLVVSLRDLVVIVFRILVELF